MKDNSVQSIIKYINVTILALSLFTSCSKGFQYPKEPPIQRTLDKTSDKSFTNSSYSAKNQPSFKVAIAPFTYQPGSSSILLDEEGRNKISYLSLEILKNYLGKEKNLY
ncbi:hypothetical protein AB751O23_BY_00050, partial [Chlamydiales bacterium SCGC AB-751-O23]